MDTNDFETLVEQATNALMSFNEGSTRGDELAAEHLDQLIAKATELRASLS